MQHFGKSCNIAAQIRAADHQPSCKATPSVYDQHCNLSSPPQFPFTFFMATSGAISRGNCRPGGVLKRKAMMRKQGGGTPTFQRTKILCVCVCVTVLLHGYMYVLWARLQFSLACRGALHQHVSCLQRGDRCARVEGRRKTTTTRIEKGRGLLFAQSFCLKFLFPSVAIN